MKHEYDNKVNEYDVINEEYRLSLLKINALKEIQIKNEIELNQQNEEIEINKEKMIKLMKMEMMIEKYQKKIEESNDVKKQNKELSLQLDKYLDQINDLESSNKGIIYVYVCMYLYVLCMFVCMFYKYVCICVCMCVCMYLYVYIQKFIRAL